MRKIAFYLFMTVAVALCLCSCKSKEKLVADYNATIVEIGAQGTAVIKAWGISSSIKNAKEEAKRNAVRAILFNGFPSSANVNSTDLRPMITDPNAEQIHKEYFEQFFKKDGKYLQFVQFADETGKIATGDMVRKGSQYKVGMVVIVNKNNLRRELENAGIIKKFGIN